MTTLAAPSRAARRVPAPGARARMRPSWGDRLAGWRDGRRGLPAGGGPGEPAGLVPTGHLMAILAECVEGTEAALRALLADTHADRVEQASAEPRMRMLRIRIEEHEERLSAALAHGPGQQRKMGEARLPDSQVGLRRAAEHDRLVAGLRARIAGARAELEAIETGQLQQLARIDAAIRRAHATVRAHRARADRRIAAYVRGAARTHPDVPGLLGAAGGLAIPEPPWLRASSADDLLSMTTTQEGAP